MKYKPRIEHEKVVCLKCGQEKPLLQHRDHATGLTICLLCVKCDADARDQTEFEGELNEIARIPYTYVTKMMLSGLIDADVDAEFRARVGAIKSSTKGALGEAIQESILLWLEKNKGN